MDTHDFRDKFGRLQGNYNCRLGYDVHYSEKKICKIFVCFLEKGECEDKTFLLQFVLKNDKVKVFWINILEIFMHNRRT